MPKANVDTEWPYDDDQDDDAFIETDDFGMAKLKSLLDEFKAAAPAKNGRKVTWFDRLPPAVQEEVNDIIDRWWNDEFRAQYPTPTHLAVKLGEKFNVGRQAVIPYIKRRENAKAR